MRALLVAFCTIIVIHSGLSQSTVYFKTFDFGSTTNPLLNNLIEIEGVIYANGNIRIPNQKILIIKTDNLGNIANNLIVGSDTGKYYTGVFIKRFNSELMISGSYEKNITYIYHPFFIFIDTALVLNSDTINENYYTHFDGNVKINNSYYFSGSAKINNSGDTIPSINTMFWKTDSNFNHISHNSIGNDNITCLSSCIVSGFDNNLLLGGLTLANGNQQDWYLINCDTNGTVQGEYFYGHPTNTDQYGIVSMTTGFDSTYLLAGVFHKYYVPPSTYSYRAPTIIKLDRQFNTLWTKHYGKPIPSTSLQKIVSTSDNCHAIIVQRCPYSNLFVFYSQITKINNNGDILWSRNYYQGDTTDYIRYRAWDMIETSDSGFAFCGSAIDTANVGPYQQAWLVKTDSLGCDGLRSCIDTAMAVQILNHTDTLCKDSSYNIAVRLKGRSAPYSLYTNGNLALDSIYYPDTLPLWIDTVIPVVLHDTGWQNLVVALHEPWERSASDTVQVYVRNCPTTANLTEYYKQKVEIYPNPATTELHVKIRGLIEDTYTISMYNTQGKTIDIITTKEQETVIDISKYRQGIYWVRVLGNNLARSEKIIILNND